MHTIPGLPAQPAFLQAVLDAMPAHIALLDSQARVVAVNAAWRQFAEQNGYQDDYGLGANYLAVCDAAAGNDAMIAAAAAEGLRTLLAGSGPAFELTYPCHAPWERRWFSMHAERLDWPGEPVVLVAHANITAAHLVEEQLIAESSEVASTRAEFNRFAVMASHDLREPARTVATYARLLTERLGRHLDAVDAQLLDYLLNGAERMQEMLAGLLAFARAGTNTTPLMRTSLATAVQRACDDLRALISESGATVDIGALPEVLGHPVLLAELFQNLISNAITYRSVEPPHVVIRAERREQEWVVTVRDNGIGIAPAHHQRIFELFQRLHHVEDFPGFGIGLAICRQIVQRHGGRIWVDSRPGEGACFSIALPANW